MIRVVDPYSREARIRDQFDMWVKYAFERDFLTSSQIASIADWWCNLIYGSQVADSLEEDIIYYE